MPAAASILLVLLCFLTASIDTCMYLTSRARRDDGLMHCKRLCFTIRRHPYIDRVSMPPMQAYIDLVASLKAKYA